MEDKIVVASMARKEVSPHKAQGMSMQSQQNTETTEKKGMMNLSRGRATGPQNFLSCGKFPVMNRPLGNIPVMDGELLLCEMITFSLFAFQVNKSVFAGYKLIKRFDVWRKGTTTEPLS